MFPKYKHHNPSVKNLRALYIKYQDGACLADCWYTHLMPSQMDMEVKLQVAIAFKKLYNTWRLNHVSLKSITRTFRTGENTSLGDTTTRKKQEQTFPQHRRKQPEKTSLGGKSKRKEPESFPCQYKHKEVNKRLSSCTYKEATWKGCQVRNTHKIKMRRIQCNFALK